MGNHVVALGQADDLHGHTFAFAGDHVGDQLPSTFLEPAQGGALGAFSTVDVNVPSAAVVTAHCVPRLTRLFSYQVPLRASRPT